MPHVTTIYVASSRPERFRFLEEEFPDRLTFTVDCEAADLLIVDLTDPVPPRDWVRSNALCLVPQPCRPPFLLTALDGPEDERVFNVIKDVVSVVPPVHKSQEDLRHSVAWIHSTFPLRNVSNVPDLKAKTAEMLVQAVKVGL